ncbi:MAG: LuxR C-terminal-related transcriptional regulator, partial [Halanaerobiales bacterium]|nr:LuxR C-terminal-related transcriptional regulator [Halanaerobiales bacterium]
QEAVMQGTMQDYINKLLHTLKIENQNRIDQTSQSSPPGYQSPVDPLSQRELEILELIAQGLSNSEIGERLFLALDTVKGHNRNIFSKLQVKRRTAAVARARELGLI